MTIVAVANFFSELTVLSDSLVSVDNQPYRPGYGLLKTVAIHSPDAGTVAIIGFAGYLNVIQPILSSVMSKLDKYRRRMVMAHLKDDLQGWITEAAIKLLDKRVGETKFLLCGLEGRRRQRAIVPCGTGVSPFRECHIYLYSITDSGKVMRSEGDTGTVIGSGSQLQQEIWYIAHWPLASLGEKSPDLDKFRGTYFASLVAERFAEAKITTVGGPYQVIITRPRYMKDHYFWPDEQPDGHKILAERLDDGVKLMNTENGRTCHLLTIWDWRRRFPEDFTSAATASC